MNEKNINMTLSSPEMEKKLLSQIVSENGIMLDATEYLKPEDFSDKRNQAIFTAMWRLYIQSANIDCFTVMDKLGDDAVKQITQSYITDICMPSKHNGYEYQINVIKELSNRRKLLSNIEKLKSSLFDINTDYVSETNKLIDTTLINANKGVELMTMDDIMEETLDHMVEAQLNGGKITGMETGLEDLDEATNGCVKGELWVVGGRPSMGKTTFGVNILKGVAQNNKCIFFSMEQQPYQIGTKLLSQETGYNSMDLDRGRFEDDKKFKAMDVAEKLKGLNLKVDKRAGITIDDIEAVVKREIQTNGVDLIMIDYLSRMRIDDKDTTRSNAIGRVTQRLADMAKQYGICIILFSQLSRDCEKRTDKRPVLSDLRDSGEIEQDADVILFLYRDEYYNKETEDKGILEVNVAKCRNGKVGLVPLIFKPEVQLIMCPK